MSTEVWQERWEILNRQILALQNQLEQYGDFPRKQSLAQLVSHLRHFAEKQFRYFYDGFREGKLLPSDKYPPEYALTVTLEQIAYDLEALQKAIHQRQDNREVARWALEVSETLAWQALKPFVQPFDLNDITVITYFQKFPEIRMIPYASVALVGIPMSCIPLPDQGGGPVIQDYLAIPHEIGHFIYWYGKITDNEGNKVRVRRYLAKQLNELDWGEDWIEEVFADVVGCLIAGPAIAQSFQDLQRRVSVEKFFRDDGDHPAPVLRPDIYTKVLRKKWGMEWAVELNTRWQKSRQEREKMLLKAEGESGLEFLYKQKGEKKSVDKAIHLVDSKDDPLIDSKLDGPIDIMVINMFSLIDWPGMGWWHDYFQDVSRKNSDPYELFGDHFRSYFVNEKSQDVKNKPLEQPRDDVYQQSHETLLEEWKKEGQDIANQGGQSPVESEEIAVSTIESDKISPQIWITVLRAGGWSTRGPVDNPTGGG